MAAGTPNQVSPKRPSRPGWWAGLAAAGLLAALADPGRAQGPERLPLPSEVGTLPNGAPPAAALGVPPTTPLGQPMITPEMAESEIVEGDGAFWADAGYLYWWIKPMPLSRPLVTTGTGPNAGG